MIEHWADTVAPKLREDIRNHLELFAVCNTDPDEFETPVRLILISARDWAQARRDNAK